MHRISYLSHNWLALRANNHHVARRLADGTIRGVVYDLGCGTAPYRDDILSRADRWVGVDWGGSPHATRADVLADLNLPLPMADDSADTVVAFSVIEHLHRPQCLLAESFRMLRSGGSLVLQVPWQWGVHEAPYDYWRFTPYGLTRMLEQTGFVEVEIAAQGGFGSMWALKSSYILRRLARGPAWRRLPMSLVCVPCWFILQLLGPFVDRLDRDPQCETCGYTVRARRP